MEAEAGDEITGGRSLTESVTVSVVEAPEGSLAVMRKLYDDLVSKSGTPLMVTAWVVGSSVNAAASVPESA